MLRAFGESSCVLLRFGVKDELKRPMTVPDPVITTHAAEAHIIAPTGVEEIRSVGERQGEDGQEECPVLVPTTICVTVSSHASPPDVTILTNSEGSPDTCRSHTQPAKYPPTLFSRLDHLIVSAQTIVWLHKYAV